MEKTTVSETDFIRWWLGLEEVSRLSDCGTDDAYLLERGHRNMHDGPDFLNARLLFGGEILKGDVEFHVNEGDWHSHGHHEDPRYDNVILHLVANSSERKAVTCSGRRVHCLVVQPGSDIPHRDLVCQLTGKCGEEESTASVAQLARIRWLRKVSHMRQSITRSGDVREAFYSETFRALGYKGNEGTFKKLSKLVPLSRLSKLGGREEVAVFLYGCSGLLDIAPIHGGAKREDRHRMWKEISGEYERGQLISSRDWNRMGIRPNAFPERRLEWGTNIAWALVNGWKPWKESVDEILRRGAAAFDGKSVARGWRTEWLGNVVLPLCEGWDQLLNEGGNDTRFEHWFQLKVGYTYGRIWRHFSGYITRKQLCSFGVQQGLLALSERYCEQDLCRLCPLKAH